MAGRKRPKESKKPCKDVIRSLGVLPLECAKSRFTLSVMQEPAWMLADGGVELLWCLGGTSA